MSEQLTIHEAYRGTPDNPVEMPEHLDAGTAKSADTEQMDVSSLSRKERRKIENFGDKHGFDAITLGQAEELRAGIEVKVEDMVRDMLTEGFPQRYISERMDAYRQRVADELAAEATKNLPHETEAEQAVAMQKQQQVAALLGATKGGFERVSNAWKAYEQVHLAQEVKGLHKEAAGLNRELRPAVEARLADMEERYGGALGQAHELHIDSDELEKTLAASAEAYEEHEARMPKKAKASLDKRRERMAATGEDIDAALHARNVNLAATSYAARVLEPQLRAEGLEDSEVQARLHEARGTIYDLLMIDGWKNELAAYTEARQLDDMYKDRDGRVARFILGKRFGGEDRPDWHAYRKGSAQPEDRFGSDEPLPGNFLSRTALRVSAAHQLGTLDQGKRTRAALYAAAGFHTGGDVAKMGANKAKEVVDKAKGGWEKTAEFRAKVARVTAASALLVDSFFTPANRVEMVAPRPVVAIAEDDVNQHNVAYGDKDKKAPVRIVRQLEHEPINRSSV